MRNLTWLIALGIPLLFCSTAAITASESRIPTSAIFATGSVTQLPRHMRVKPWETIPENLHDYSSYLLSPMGWNTEQWNTFWGVIGITGLLFLVDKPLYDWVDPNKLETVNGILNPWFQIGEWENVAVGIPCIYGIGFLSNDLKLQHASFVAMKSFMAEVVVVQGMKAALYRDLRHTRDPFVYKGPNWTFPSHGALPSGHASITWSVLTSYAECYKDDPWIPKLCYGSAILSSLTLITTANHWISDIFLGAAIGYYTALSVIHFEEKRDALEILPTLLETGGYGVKVTQRF